MFAEVVDKSTGTSIEEARTQLGQVKSATGTFQNVAMKALNSARAQKLALDSSTTTTSTNNNNNNYNNGQTDATRLDALKQLANGAAGGMPALSALREQISATFADGNTSLDSIRQEMANGRSIPALEELQRQAQLSAGRLANGKEDLERMRKDIASGMIPPEVLAALSGRDGEAPRIAENHSEIESVNVDALLSPTDLLDAAQMIAVANKQFGLVSGETRKNVTQSTINIAQSNIKKAWTKERQERLVLRSRKLIVDCQVNNDYKSAVEWFLERIETYASAIQQKVELPSSSLDSALSSAFEPFIQLLENVSIDKREEKKDSRYIFPLELILYISQFAAGRSLRSILETAKTLSSGAKDDPEIQSFWKDVDHYARRCLVEEGYVLTKEAERGAHDLVKRFHSLKESYKINIVKLISESASFAQAITQDELLRAFIKSTKNVIADLTFAKEGTRIPPQALLRDLRDYILPPLLDKFGVIPVPRIRYLHPDFDLVIENIAINLKSLLPDTFDFQMTNDIHVDFHKVKSSSHEHSFKIKLKGMSIRVYKLAYAVTTKMGIKFHDHGIADLQIADFGVTIYIDVPKDPGPHYFIVKKVKAKLGKLQLKIYQSNHRILHALASSLVNSYLTRRILRHFIAMGINIGLKQLDVALMSRRLNRDTEEGKMSVEEMKKQMAELRNLLKNYHEMAGAIEIDFTRDDDDDADKMNIGKSIEDSHAFRWVKKQVNETGRKEIVRNDWRSNAFDMDTLEKQSTQKEAVAEKVDKPIEESSKAAEIRKKPEGPTSDAIVKRASIELKKAEEQE